VRIGKIRSLLGRVPTDSSETTMEDRVTDATVTLLPGSRYERVNRGCRKRNCVLSDKFTAYSRRKLAGPRRCK
jgi:hypothetical protein